MIEINGIRSELFHDLRLHGHLASDDDVQALRDGVLPLLEGGVRHLAFHLDAIRFVTSPGLKIFTHIQQMCESQGGGICLVVQDARLREIVEFAGLSRQIAVYASEDDLRNATAALAMGDSTCPAWPRLGAA